MVRPVDALPPALAQALGDVLAMPRNERDPALAALCEAHPQHADAIRTYAMALATLQSTPAQNQAGPPPATLPRLRLKPLSGDPEPLLAPPSETRLGKYQVHDAIGFGGVGVVWRGTDEELGRVVALKVLRAEHEQHADVVQRFVEEAQIGGQLQHPGIVPVYDFGTAGGRPFFAMKLVSGHTLADELLRQRTGDARTRLLGVFAQICQTMAYAHARGVVHRDLKPHNVMLGRFGEVQIVDWGLSKVLGSHRREPQADATPRTDAGHQSLAGSVLGTPQYMPPEQARGDSQATGPWSDVFSLGAILCEILTGKPPYPPGEFGAGGVAALVQRAATADLAECHRALAACGADHEVVAICRACLAADPAQRPADAGVVAKQVADYLATAEARVQSARLRTAVVRTRLRQLGWLTAALLLALAAAIYFMFEARAQREAAAQANAKLEGALADANAQRDRAHAAQREAETQAALARQLGEEAAASARAAEQRAAEARAASERASLAETQATANAQRALEAAAAAQRERADAVAARERTEAEKRAKEAALAETERARDANRRRASLATYAAQFTAAQAALERSDAMHPALALPDASAPELRGFEHGHLALRLSQSTHALELGAPLVALAAAGDVALVGVRRSDANLLFVDSRDLQVRKQVGLGQGGPFAVAASRDGRLFASADGSGAVQLWRSDGTAVPSAPLPNVGRATCLAFAPDASRLAYGGLGDEVPIVEVATGRELARLRVPGGITALVLTDTGTLLGNSQGHLSEFDAAHQLRRVRPLHEGALLGLDFDARGNHAVCASLDGSIRLFSLADEQRRDLAATGSGALDARFTADGAQVLTGHADGRLRVWDVASLRLLGELRGHGDYVTRLVNLSTDQAAASTALSTSLDGTLRRWLPAARGPSHLLETTPANDFHAVLPHGERIVVLGTNRARLFDIGGRAPGLQTLRYGEDGWAALLSGVPQAQPPRGIVTQARDVLALTASPDLRFLLLFERSDALTRLDLHSGEVLTAPWRGKRASCAALGGDGEVLLGTESGEVLDHDARGQVRRRWQLGRRIVALAGGADLIVAAIDGEPLRLLRGEQESRALQRSAQRTVALALSRDGQRIAAGGEDGSVTILASESALELSSLPRRAYAVRAVTFADDDQRLLVLHEDGAVAIHDSAAAAAAALWRRYGSGDGNVVLRPLP